ncbi:MAG: MFS transporter [Synechococcales cyanobacterium CRU_2_2]|nr:MFS transporter [Synechococcales cyanobacterium CRU_2_2]
MRTFIKLWLGQLVSTIGSYMTVFALMIWVWQTTESATTLAMVSFFSQLPRIAVMPMAGLIVDRIPRKLLILVGDMVAALCTLAIALLYISDQLQIWHLFSVVAIYGGFGQLQNLAYSTSIALLVEPDDYARAESMVAGVNYSGAIFSPILAGSLYPQIGLEGIFGIDLATFAIALVTLLLSQIPQPLSLSGDPANSDQDAAPAVLTFWQDLSFGFRYIWRSPGLLALVICFSLFALPNDLGKALYNPMILARSGGDPTVLGHVTTAAGLGGVLGAIIISAWGGFKRRIHGMLLGFMLTGLFKVILGIGASVSVWTAAHFAATLAIPLYYSSSNAIWYSKVPPQLQGRVLAADQMIGLTIGATVPLLAGPLADRVFEPAMQPEGWLSPYLSVWFGSAPGSGMAVLYVLMSLSMVLVGAFGYGVRLLRNVEDVLPDSSSCPATSTHH